MSDQKHTERKPLNVEDVAALMAIKSQVESHYAAISALEGMHNTLLESLHHRYDAPTAAGWRLQDYVIGFVKLPPGHEEHEHLHTNGHHHH